MKNLINKFFSDVKLKQRVFILFSVTIIVQIVFGMIVNLMVVGKRVMNDSLNYTRDFMTTIQQRVTEQILGVIDLSQSVFYNPEIYDILEMNYNNTMQIENYELQNQINSILKGYMFSQNAVQSIVLYNLNNYPYIWDCDNDFQKVEKIPRDIMQTDLHGEPEWVISDGNVYLVREICDKNTLNKIGTMVILLKFDFLENIFNNTESISGIILLSQDGKSIFSKHIDNEGYEFDENDMFDKINGKTGYFIEHTHKYLINFSGIEKIGWSLLITTPLKRIYRSIKMVLGIIMLFGFLVLLFTFIVNRRLVNSIIMPINKLSSYILEFEKTGSIKLEHIKRKDELGYLMNCFIDMTNEIKSLIDNIYVEKIHRKNAQIKALQSQINPHFLYNTLETINWTAQLKGVTEVSDMITNLADLMEANAGKKNAVITVAEELGYVKNYCEIIKYRYPEGIIFKYAVEDDCLQEKVPCLIIQPLVENAISHGINKSSRRGIILIKIKKKNESDIEIQVADNGVGMDEEELCELNESINEDFDITREEVMSVGLINTNLRIKLFYGENYGIKVTSKKDCYCCVNCIISKELQVGK